MYPPVKVIVLTLMFQSSALCLDCSTQKVLIVTDLPGDITDKPQRINATEFLWHVAVLKQEEEGMVFLCSGTIIQAKYVLTAARCVVHVTPSHLRVVANLSLLHSTLQTTDSSHSIYNVSEKYYPYHQNGFTQEEDLAILKLQENVTHATTLLAPLPPTEHLSKNCFTLGWGMQNHNHGEKLESSCPKTSAQKALTVLLNQPEQRSYNLHSIFDIGNSLALSSSFMFKVFNIFSTNNQAEYRDGSTCPLNEYTHVKMVKVSAKRKRDWTFCSKSSHLCLSGWNSTNLAKQMDIGSPIFCEVRKPRFGKTHRKEPKSISQFGLAGVITSKNTELVNLMKLNSSISVIKANNITHFAHFIFSVLKQNV